MGQTVEQEFRRRFGTPVREGGTQIKFQCPQCGRKSLVCFLETARFFCFLCEYGRGAGPIVRLSEPPQRREVDVDKHRQVALWLAENLQTSASHRAYLRKRGIFNPDAYQIRTCPAQMEVRLLSVFGDEFCVQSGFLRPGRKGFTGRPALALNRILIPVRDDEGVASLKVRVDPYDEATEPSKFYTAPGPLLSRTLSRWSPIAGDVLVTEGELKAIAAHQHGFNACSISGIGGIKAAIGPLKEGLASGKVSRVFVVFDTEANPSKLEGRTQAAKLAKALGDRCAIVMLPTLQPRRKVDLDSYLVEWGETALEDLLEESWIRRKETFEQEKGLIPLEKSMGLGR